MSFYVSTAIYFLLHCDEWDLFVAPPRHKFVTEATLLQLKTPEGGAFLCVVFLTMLTTVDVNIHASNCQIWYRHPNEENIKVRPEMTKFKMSREKVNMDFYFVGITF